MTSTLSTPAFIPSPSFMTEPLKSIEIPTRDGSEVVEVFLDELPEDSNAICEILLEEAAPFELFHQFALEYYKRNLFPGFVLLLKRGTYEAKRKPGLKSNLAIVRMLSTLAAYHISEGLKTCASGDTKGREFLEEATEIINDAEKVSSAFSPELSIRKGLLLLAKNVVDSAGFQFKYCLERKNDNIPALLGQACVFLLTQNYRSALASFQGLLKVCPQFNLLRVAIGHCFHHLGHNELALKAFKRALEVDSDCQDAIIALGFLNLSKHGESSALKEGMIQMKLAYGMNKNNPVALLHLSNHFFFARDFDKARVLAESCLRVASNDRLKAEAHFILAKIYHATNEFLDAFENYQLSVKFEPAFVPSIFGLGQCFLIRNDLGNAAMMFKKVIEIEKACPEAMRLLVLINMSLLSRLNESDSECSSIMEKVHKLLPQVLESFPADPVIVQCAAVLFESSNPLKSIDYYDSLLSLNQAAFENFAILNNHAVLKHSLGGINQGSAQIEQALNRLQSATAPIVAQISPFLKFNRARLLEDEGRSSEAEAIYRSLLTDPYTSALSNLRLGSIHFRSGQYAEAADCFKDVMGSNSDHKDAWNCLAATHLKQKALNPARKSFERVLQDMDKNDSYALVSLGNIYIELVRNDKSKTRTDDYHKRASEFFIKALSVDKGNAYAAQGLGIIFAERGALSDAKSAFTQVRSALEESKSVRGEQELVDATLNLAHVLTELGQPAAAVSLYESVIALKRQYVRSESPGKFVSLLLYLCRARYLLAVASGDWTVLDAAIETVKEACTLLPNDLPILFNKALLFQQRAAVIHSKATHNVDIEEGKENVSEAERIYSDLEAANWDQVKLLKTQLLQCREIYAGLAKFAEENEKTLKDQTERLEQLKLHREVQLREAEELKRQQEACERQKAAEIEIARRELALRMQETEEKIRSVSSTVSKHRESTSKRSRSKSKRKPTDSEDEDEEDEASSSSENEINQSEEDLDGITKSRRRGVSSKVESALSKEFVSSGTDEE